MTHRSAAPSRLSTSLQSYANEEQKGTYYRLCNCDSLWSTGWDPRMKKGSVLLFQKKNTVGRLLLPNEAMTSPLRSADGVPEVLLLRASPTLPGSQTLPP